MDQYDYKTINIPQGSECEFHRVFQTFGYRPIISQNVTLERATDGKIIGKGDMTHYYYPQEADEALLGLSLHTNDPVVDNYVRLTYGRNRFGTNFANLSKAEHAYNRMTYDCYLLYLKAKKAKKRKRLPLFFLILFLILLVGGIASTLVGFFNGGAETALLDVLEGGAFGMCFWFGMAGIVLGLFFFIVFGTLRNAIQGAKAGRYKNAIFEIETMKSDFRNAFRHTNSVPEFDSRRLQEIERINKLY